VPHSEVLVEDRRQEESPVGVAPVEAVREAAWVRAGLSGSGGPPRFDQAAVRRYSLTFAAMARNVFNNVNLSQPVGVLD
jgi:hypothetical protein